MRAGAGPGPVAGHPRRAPGACRFLVLAGGLAALAGLAAAGAMACHRPATAPAGPGRRVVEGEVRLLQASADGAWLSVLRDCTASTDRTLPPGSATCALEVVPSAGGASARAAARIASGVSTLPGSHRWSGAGHVLVALHGQDAATGAGTLVAWAGGPPRTVASGVSYWALSPGGERLGWVAGGEVATAALPAGAPEKVAGPGGAATLELGGADGAVLIRQQGARGGELRLARGRSSERVATAVKDYAFGPGGGRYAFTSGEESALAAGAARGGRPVLLGRRARSFLFAPDGSALAWLAGAGAGGGKPSELWVAALPAGKPERLSASAAEPRFAGGEGEGADGAKGVGRLAWLDGYDGRNRTGTLTVGAPAGRSRAISPNVSHFVASPAGDALAYLVHDTAGGLSVDLGLVPLEPGGVAAPAAQAGAAAQSPGGAAAQGGAGVGVRVARGVFGFSFSPDGRWLYYRTACVREAEACDLHRVPARATDQPQPASERIADGVKSWSYAPGRPGRLLVAWSRTDRVALDLALWEGGKLTALDTMVLPGSAAFVGGDARRVAWAVMDPKRAGAYLADVP